MAVGERGVEAFPPCGGLRPLEGGPDFCVHRIFFGVAKTSDDAIHGHVLPSVALPPDSFTRT